jgi:ketosteroid isomerase-like protein
MVAVRTLVAAIVLSLPAAAAAAMPPGLVETLHHFARAAAGTDKDAFAHLFADDSSITDTVYPYHWQGHDAARHYFDALQEDLKSVGWTDFGLTEHGDPFVVARPGFAYAAIPLSVDYKAHGANHSNNGVFSLSLVQTGKEWKITSATWTYAKEHLEH